MISLIIPTYQEKENIGKLLTSIDQLKLNDFEVIVVDDQSPDGTADQADLLAQKLSLTIKVIKRNGPRDLSLSVLDGFKGASGDRLGVMDADLSHPPALIPKLIKALAEADLVVASRNVVGAKTKNWPWKRKINAWVSKNLALTLTRKTSDPMSGYFFFKKNIIAGINLKPLGYKILLEILVRSRVKKISEIPFVFEERAGGKSKLNLKIILKFLVHVLKLHLWKMTRRQQI